MRRYASSRFRLVLLAGLTLAAAFVSVGYGQATPAPAGGATAAPAATNTGQSIVQLIFSHKDFVFFTIALLSLVGVTLIIQGFIKNRASVFIPESSLNAMRDLIEQKKLPALLEYTESDPSFVSRAMNSALKRAPSFVAMKEAMETSIGEQTAEQFRKIEYLNIIGNLGPLLGLLGTVMGMIEAFQAVYAAGGQANVAQLSNGISTALTHTFLGLMLAVPCLAAFGVLRTLVDRLTVRGALEAEELLLMVKPADARPAAAPTAAAAPVASVAPRPVMTQPMPAPTVVRRETTT